MGISKGQMRRHGIDVSSSAVTDIYDRNLTVQDHGVLRQAELIMTESTNGNGSYKYHTGAVVIPVGATVHDVIIRNAVKWTGNAAITVGDTADADGYFLAVNVATTLASNVDGAGGISCFLTSTGAGSYAAKTKRYASAGVVTAVLTHTGAGSAALGSTVVVVMYGLTAQVAATIT